MLKKCGWIITLTYLLSSAACAATTEPSDSDRGATADFLAKAGQAPFFDVQNYGAVSDGKTADTVFIQKAIDAASAAGGGTVRFAAGQYLSGVIHLKDNVSLLLEKGCTLIAAYPGPGIAYDPPEPNPAAANYQDFGHTHFNTGFICGIGLKNIAILGPGMIFGQACSTGDHGPSDRAISLKLCKNVILKDVTIFKGGHFALLATGCDQMTIDHVTVDTNRDGFDVDCCNSVMVSNCTVNSPQDDAIVLKASYGLGELRGCDNVTVTQCHVSGYECGTLLDGTKKKLNKANGRLKLGTESNGSFHNIDINHCTCDSCSGLALETVDGSELDHVVCSDIEMHDIRLAPIFLRLGARLRGPKETTHVGVLQHVIVRNVVCDASDPKYGCIITGIPGHNIQDILLENIKLTTSGGGTKEQGDIQPPEEEKAYPDPNRFGQIPAYGFYVRHADGITFKNVQIICNQPDLRPAFVIDDGANLMFDQVTFPHADGGTSFLFQKTKGFTIQNCSGVPDLHLDDVQNKKM